MPKDQPRSVNDEVGLFLEQLQHPLKPQILAVRETILTTAPNLEEQIKWNAPSYSLNGDDRITFNLHGKNHFRLIFHCGAKKLTPPGSPLIKDPHILLKWPADDRAILEFKSAQDTEDLKQPLAEYILAWLQATT